MLKPPPINHPINQRSQRVNGAPRAGPASTARRGRTGAAAAGSGAAGAVSGAASGGGAGGDVRGETSGAGKGVFCGLVYPWASQNPMVLWYLIVRVSNGVSGGIQWYPWVFGIFVSLFF